MGEEGCEDEELSVGDLLARGLRFIPLLYVVGAITLLYVRLSV